MKNPSKDLRKNKPEFKPRLKSQDPAPGVVRRHPEDEGEVELTEKEIKEKIVVTSTPPTGTVDLLNPAFDPDIPEQKQRNFR
jgi:hypothetical protein